MICGMTSVKLRHKKAIAEFNQLFFFPMMPRVALPELLPALLLTLDTFEVCSSEAFIELTKLKIKSVAGPDGPQSVTPWECASYFSKLLANLFDKPMADNDAADSWKR